MFKKESFMKCQFCNVEMVYKPNMRGLYKDTG